MEILLRRLLSYNDVALDRLEAWWNATRDVREQQPTTADRALIGGVLADRLGFAFASGYQEALRALVKHDGIATLCVTEARGNSPKDIDTTLAPSGAGFIVTGNKKWATAAPLASSLLVCAKTGVDAQGRNMLRMVRVPTSAPGVTLTPNAAPFVPEIPHAEVTLDNVAVPADAVLPGDGYTDYVKPFRTIEDAHVQAALVGYLIGVARRNQFARELIEQLVASALVVRAIALADATSAAVHVALAGAFNQVTQLVAEIERAWGAAGGDEWTRWQRDRPLLRVASAARAARRESAWAAIRP